MSLRNFIIKSVLLRKKRKWNKRLQGSIPTVEAMRKRFDDMTARFEMPEGISIKKLNVEGIETEWMIPPDAHANEIIFYLHGGGYCMGDINNYRAFVAKLALESGSKVMIINYSLAPEKPYPAALEDSLKIYQWLNENGYRSVSIVLAGDSAGGGLVLSTMLAARDRGIVLPAGAVLLSPLTDLACTGDSFYENDKKDPVLSANIVAEIGKWYAGDIPLDDPRISPLYADYTHIPPMLIQVGTSEILLNDSTRLASRAKDAGVEVEIDVWQGQMHVWQMLWKELPEAEKAIEKIGSFTRQRFGQGRILYHEV